MLLGLGIRRTKRQLNKSGERKVAHNGESDHQQMSQPQEVIITEQHPKHQVAETSVSSLIGSA